MTFAMACDSRAWRAWDSRVWPLRFPKVASAAEPVPTLYWTVDPPTLGQSHSPNPVDGTTGVPTQIALELATNNDLANNPAPTGTVTFSDSLGIITGNCNNAPAQPQDLDASYAYCTVTFPSGTAGDDIVTATYSGDSNNGASHGYADDFLRAGQRDSRGAGRRRPPHHRGRRRRWSADDQAPSPGKGNGDRRVR